MNKRIKRLLVTVDDLREQGDWWDDDFRLPEFKFYATDESGVKHPMHAVGRYLICGIHGNPVTSALNVTGGSEVSCQRMAAQWHAALAGHLGGTLATLAPTGSSGGEKDFVFMQRCIAATMVKRAGERCPELDPASICWLLDLHPSLTNDWLLLSPEVDFGPIISLALYAVGRLSVAPALKRNSEQGQKLRALVVACLLDGDTQLVKRLDQAMERNTFIDSGSGVGWSGLLRSVYSNYFDDPLGYQSAPLTMQRRGDGMDCIEGTKFEQTIGGHQLVVGQTGSLECRAHQSASCERWREQLMTELIGLKGRQGPGAGAVASYIEQQVDREIELSNTTAKEILVYGILQQPRVWESLGKLREFAGYPLPLAEVASYIALGLCGKDVETFVGQNIGEAWRIKLALQLGDLRPELPVSELAQLSSSWTERAYLELQNDPEVILAVTKCQDRGHEFAAIVAETLPPVVAEVLAAGRRLAHEPKEDVSDWGFSRHAGGWIAELLVSVAKEGLAKSWLPALAGVNEQVEELSGIGVS